MKIHGTATGGALSKKDFGVAFSGAAASTFSPTDISDLICWYDASSGITKDGSDLVSKWENKEGTSGRDLVQATASDKPTFLSDGGSTSENPAVDFTGGSIMQIDYGESFNQAYTMCSACYVPANDSNERILFDGGETGATPGSLRAYFGKMDSANAFRIRTDTNVNFTQSGIVGTWIYVIILYDGADSYVRMNGSEVATGNPGTDALQPLTLGQFIDGSSAQSWNEPIMHFLIYDKELDADEIEDIESWLSDQIG
jgi:hypothetical protein